MGNKEFKAGKYGKLPDTVPIDKLHKFTHFSQEQIYDLLERFRRIAADRVVKPQTDDELEIELIEAALNGEELSENETNELDIKTFGGLTYEDFRGLFHLPDSKVAQQCFNLFDSNQDGLVDFRDFVVGMSMCYSGTLEEKLFFCFNIWDTEGHGYITRDEMRTLVQYLVRLGDVLIEDDNGRGQRMSMELTRGAEDLPGFLEKADEPDMKDRIEDEMRKEKEKGRESERDRGEKDRPHSGRSSPKGSPAGGGGRRREDKKSRVTILTVKEDREDKDENGKEKGGKDEVPRERKMAIIVEDVDKEKADDDKGRNVDWLTKSHRAYKSEDLRAEVVEGTLHGSQGIERHSEVSHDKGKDKERDHVHSHHSHHSHHGHSHSHSRDRIDKLKDDKERRHSRGDLKTSHEKKDKEGDKPASPRKDRDRRKAREERKGRKRTTSSSSEPQCSDSEEHSPPSSQSHKTHSHSDSEDSDKGRGRHASHRKHPRSHSSRSHRDRQDATGSLPRKHKSNTDLESLEKESLNSEVSSKVHEPSYIQPSSAKSQPRRSRSRPVMKSVNSGPENPLARSDHGRDRPHSPSALERLTQSQTLVTGHERNHGEHESDRSSHASTHHHGHHGSHHHHSSKHRSSHHHAHTLPNTHKGASQSREPPAPPHVTHSHLHVERPMPVHPHPFHHGHSHESGLNGHYYTQSHGPALSGNTAHRNNLQELHGPSFCRIKDSPMWARNSPRNELASSHGSERPVVIRASKLDINEQVERFVDEIFEEADSTKAGHITFTDFKRWAAKNPLVTHFLAHFDVMLIDMAEEKEQQEYEEEERKKLDVTWHAPKVDPMLLENMQLEEFRWLRKLGQGSYGDVWLVNYEGTDLLFAMKCIKKKRLVNDAMLSQARAEKKALLRNTHPFIVHLDDCYVYLLFEYVSGGELDHYFRANNRCFDLHTTKFYAAELVLAIEYLHAVCGTAHRDIKLNNVMVNSEGHLRLCDFGFARFLEKEELAYTLVGTPEYLPPEVLRGKGYALSCDWWSLGITIYKMLNGHGPFWRTNRAAIFQAILDCKYEFPSHFDPATRDLLRGLLHPNEKKRLGTTKGAAAIKAHPWFKEIEWEKLEREQIMPPFVPETIPDLYDEIEKREPPEEVPESYKRLFLDF